MKINSLMSAVLLAAVLLSACAQPGAGPAPATPAPQETPAATTEEPPAPTAQELPAAVEAARQALAKQLDIDPAQVQVHTYDPVEWPDSCLGAANAGEVCAQAITPGFGGMLVAGGVQYEFHSDQSGENLRFIPGPALSARQVLAQQLHLDLGQILLVSAEPVEWPDACLGVQVEGMSCAQAITPGYKVILDVAGQRYEYHTDDTGGTVLLASAPQAEVKDAAVVWQKQDGVCETAQIGSQQVAFGTCGGVLMTGKFASPERAADLSYFVQTYAPFTAETPAGKVTFTGQGAQQADPAEQRMIAEWAHLVFVEAAGGRSGASYGLALAWHREGGIAGFCDDLTVYVTGDVYATSCKGGQPADMGRSRLTAAQLQQLYTWVDSLKAFELDQKDPATADAMAVRVVFSGAGSKEAADPDKQAIQNFAQELYTNFAPTS